jgi:K+-sensing histidine kinase KdpD
MEGAGSSSKGGLGLVGLIVHDLKNPLSGIVGNAQYALSLMDLPGEAREALQDAVSAAEAMNRMLLNIHDVASHEEGKLVLRMSAVNLGALAREAVRALEARSALGRQPLAAETAHEGPMIQGDRDRLLRLLENLLDYALRYGPRGAAIRLTVRDVDGARVEAKVTDEGPAVPEPYRDRIFDPRLALDRAAAAQARPSRGMGLAACRVIALAHGGEITLGDNVPAGVALSVVLPVRPVRVAAP